MQITDRPKAASRTASAKKRTRKFPWPQLCIFLIAVFVLVRLVMALKASGFLVILGLCGLGFACKTAMHMNFGSWPVSRQTRKILTGLWLAITVFLCLSFIFSGVSHAMGGPIGARLASVEAKRTAFAIVIFIFWLIGSSPARRAGIIHIILWTAAVIEAARLLAFGLHPSVLSYIIWTATLVSIALRFRRSETRYSLGNR